MRLRLAVLLAAVAGLPVTGSAQLGQISPQAAPIVATGSTRPRSLADHLGDEVKAMNFGTCVWDGAHDVSPCIQAAITAAASAGGGIVQIPPGHWPIASGLTIGTSAVGLRGKGVGLSRDTISPSNFLSTTSLVWTGAAGGTMLTIMPVSALRLYKTDVTDLVLDGAGLAGTCLSAASTSNSTFEFGYSEPRTTGAVFTTASIPDTQDPQSNRITITGRSTLYPATGVLFTSLPGSPGNFSVNQIDNLYIWHNNGDAVVFGNSDNNYVKAIGTYNQGGTGRSLVFSNTATAAGNAYGNRILHFSGNAGIYALGFQTGSTIAAGAANTGNGTAGALTINATATAGTYTLTATSATAFSVALPGGGAATPATLTVGTPYAGDFSVTIAAGSTAFRAGDTFTVTVPTPSLNNQIDQIDKFNGVADPVIEAGASMQVGTNQGVMYNTHHQQAIITDNGYNWATAIRAAGPTALTISGDSDHLTLMSRDGTSSWGVGEINATGDLRVARLGGAGTLNLGNGAPASVPGTLLAGSYSGAATGASLTVANGSSNQLVLATPTGSIAWSEAILADGSLRFTRLAGSGGSVMLGNGVPVTMSGAATASGGMTVSSGLATDTLTASGAASAASLATTGALTAGNGLTVTTGNVTVSTGNVTLGAGNLTAGSGTVSAASLVGGSYTGAATGAGITAVSGSSNQLVLATPTGSIAWSEAILADGSLRFTRLAGSGGSVMLGTGVPVTMSGAATASGGMTVSSGLATDTLTASGAASAASLATTGALTAGNGLTVTTGNVTLGTGNLTAGSGTVSAGAVVGGTYTGTATGAGVTAASGSSNQLQIATPDGTIRWGAAILAGGNLRWTGLAGTANFYISAPLQLTPVTPASSSAACTAGQISVDANYVYVCTGTNTWKRAALSTF